MVFKRSYSLEIMDDFSIQDERIDNALYELKIINKYLGGISATKRGIKKIISKFKLQTKKINILDAGSGASDILFNLNKKKKYINIFSVDINKRVCFYLKEKSKNNFVICGDALNLPIKNLQIDIIHSSLFFHHLKEGEIKKILLHFYNLTKYGIIINDLHRSVFAYLGIKILTKIFSKSEMVKNDAPLSVMRGFKKKELKRMLFDLKINNFEIKRKWAFRWLVIIYKN
ncbi:MAG: methyltransferase domain-containing protein [Ignavibacteriaceae bacterium]